jgi:hypothetical protein
MEIPQIAVIYRNDLLKKYAPTRPIMRQDGAVGNYKLNAEFTKEGKPRWPVRGQALGATGSNSKSMNLL